MLAYCLFDDGPRLTELPVPEPGAGEVLVRIAGAGACHSDLHVIHATAAGNGFFTPPFTLGHENTGWVEALGAGVSTVRVGEPVAVYCAWGCGRCRMCAAGSENYCLHQKLMRGAGLGADGGMATHLLVPAARYLLPLGSLDPVDAAPLTDAGLTPYHAIKRSRDLLTPDATCVIIAVGGLGHMALQILKATTASRVIALDISEQKRRIARELGADVVIPSDEHALSATFDALGGVGADVVFDFVGLQQSIDLARKLVRPGGDCTIVGLGGGVLPYGQGRIAWGARVSTPFYGSLTDLREVLALAESGRIRAHVTRYPLERAGEAYDAMERGTLDGRAVICPNG